MTPMLLAAAVFSAALCHANRVSVDQDSAWSVWIPETQEWRAVPSELLVRRIAPKGNCKVCYEMAPEDGIIWYRFVPCLLGDAHG